MKRLYNPYDIKTDILKNYHTTVSVINDGEITDVKKNETNNNPNDIIFNNCLMVEETFNDISYSINYTVNTNLYLFLENELYFILDNIDSIENTIAGIKVETENE